MASDSVKPENSDSSQTAQTAGQRLAAARAAKAARKAAERGKDAEALEQRALEQAAVARDWIQEHITTLVAVGVGVAVIAGVAIAWASYQRGVAAEAGGQLWQAVEQIDEDKDAALQALQQVSAKGGEAAAWARLSQARVHYEMGDYAAAQAEYEAVVKAQWGERVTWLAIEGLIYNAEAKDDQVAALERVAQLQALGGRVAIIAEYHRGRLLLEQGKNDEAKQAFEKVVSELKSGEGAELDYTKRQAEERLALLDPGRPKSPSIDSARLQQLIQSQQFGR